MTDRRFYEAIDPENTLRSAPAALRNREPIADVLEEWLPDGGLVLEIASGTGEHASYFATRFPNLEWLPSDSHPDALETISARRARILPDNLREPIEIDAAASDWGIDRAAAILCSNMVHISPWASALGLLDGAARLLGQGAPLILYGPWILDGVETTASNLAFDADLKARDPRWGLRTLESFKSEAELRGLAFIEYRAMPANNVMLLFRRASPAVG